MDTPYILESFNMYPWSWHWDIRELSLCRYVFCIHSAAILAYWSSLCSQILVLILQPHWSSLGSHIDSHSAAIQVLILQPYWSSFWTYWSSLYLHIGSHSAAISVHILQKYDSSPWRFIGRFAFFLTMLCRYIGPPSTYILVLTR